MRCRGYKMATVAAATPWPTGYTLQARSVRCLRQTRRADSPRKRAIERVFAALLRAGADYARQPPGKRSERFWQDEPVKMALLQVPR